MCHTHADHSLISLLPPFVFLCPRHHHHHHQRHHHHHHLDKTMIIVGAKVWEEYSAEKNRTDHILTSNASLCPSQCHKNMMRITRTILNIGIYNVASEALDDLLQALLKLFMAQLELRHSCSCTTYICTFGSGWPHKFDVVILLQICKTMTFCVTKH